MSLLLAMWAVAFAMAQGGMVVFEGETKTYQVGSHAGSTYFWVIYNDPAFSTAASGSEVRIVSGENTSSITLNWLKPGTYYPKVVETDQTGCTNTKAVAVVVNGKSTIWPVARISNQTVLVGNSKYILSNSCQSTILDASGSSGDGLTYRWEPPIYLDNPNSSMPRFSLGLTTSYTLTVTDIYGHSSAESVGVMVAEAVKAEAGENIYIGINQSGMLDGSKSTGINLAYLWKTKTGPIKDGAATPRPVVHLPGKYYLTVTDQYGCSGTDSVLVNLYTQAVNDTISTDVDFSVDVNVLTNDIPFFIPEAFSPNGDGINDKFEIKGLAKYESVEIVIFNRWGNTVYQSGNYGEGAGTDGFWDGTAKSGGGTVPNGAYFYVLKLDGKEKISGSIYLDR